MGLMKSTHSTCRCISCLDLLVHSHLHFYVPESVFLTHAKPEVSNTQFPTCVHLALIRAILLSEAVASCHPTGAPTRGALKCPSPPTWRKQHCMSRAGAWGWYGGLVRMKGCAVAVELFALLGQQTKETQELEESIFVDLCVWLRRR